MVSFGEVTNWNTKPAVRAMYEALDSMIVPVSVESDSIESLLMPEDLDGEIVGLFQVTKASELAEFKSNIGNVRRLFHGTNVSNLIGILSRYG